jgi:hypothetical protein
MNDADFDLLNRLDKLARDFTALYSDHIFGVDKNRVHLSPECFKRLFADRLDIEWGICGSSYEASVTINGIRFHALMAPIYKELSDETKAQMMGRPVFVEGLGEVVL